jgi:hypothetical protein
MKKLIFVAIILAVAAFAYFTWRKSKKTPEEVAESMNPFAAPLSIVPSAPTAPATAPSVSPSVVTKAATLTTGIKPSLISAQTLSNLNAIVQSAQPALTNSPTVGLTMTAKQFTL